MTPSNSDHLVRFSLTLPRATPSLNEVRAMHHQVYRKLRQGFRDELFVQRVQHGWQRVPPLTRVALYIERGHSGGGLDWDNAFGGLKPLLDCLVLPTTKNPDGLGFIVDDSPEHIPHAPDLVQKSVAQGKSYTEIRVFDLDDPETQELWSRCHLHFLPRS